MELASYSTASHNIRSKLKACKFPKVFKLRSLSVFFSQTHQQKTQSTIEKLHPQPQDGAAFDIEQVFEAISELKLAYLNLQNAHLAYNPLKIIAADQCIMLQLDKLSKMNKLIKFKKVDLQALDQLESEVKARESQIIQLKKKIQALSFGNTKMIEKLSINEGMFDEIYGGVCNAIREFSKLMIILMRDSNWDLDCAAKSIDESVSYNKRCHKKYAFQAFVARRMLHLFSSQSLQNGKLRFEDPICALMEEPNSAFGGFCISKYLLLIHPKLEESFFGNLDHRKMVLKGKHPRTEFYQEFVKMCRWVWLLSEISALGKAKPEMFGVQRGVEFSDLYMESVTSELDSCNELKVELLVMPGFRVGSDIVKCKVYVSTIKHKTIV